jgi:hypothetical protein
MTVCSVGAFLAGAWLGLGVAFGAGARYVGAGEDWAGGVYAGAGVDDDVVGGELVVGAGVGTRLGDDTAYVGNHEVFAAWLLQRRDLRGGGIRRGRRADRTGREQRSRKDDDGQDADSTDPHRGRLQPEGTSVDRRVRGHVLLFGTDAIE